ncbi:MAG: S53 family peptidase [Chloroflexi bacterium]|nr:S53 family peptidase [Chloroflexota bacterium]
MTAAIAGGNDGSGVTVAVIDAYASPTIVQDVEQYSSLHGLPTIHGLFSQVVAPGTFNRPQNPRQDPQGWSGEETLDIEAVHTMAPGAKIVYVGAPNNYQDLDAALNHVVDRHLADIVTNSYGWSSEALPFGFIKPYNDTMIQAAAEGISLLFSSGDNGDETDAVSGATPTPDWPASSPWVTAVGGTSLGVDASNARQFELGWETTRGALTSGPAWATATWLYGSGGGTSRLFTQPSYQAGVVPDSISKTYGGAAMRVVPDVAAVGDPTTGMLVSQTQQFPDGTNAYSEYRIGGTSLSSPLFERDLPWRRPLRLHQRRRRHRRVSLHRPLLRPGPEPDDSRPRRLRRRHRRRLAQRRGLVVRDRQLAISPAGPRPATERIERPPDRPAGVSLSAHGIVVGYGRRIAD